MKPQKIMLFALAAVSLMLLPLLVWFPEHDDHLALAQKTPATKNEPLSDASNNVQVDFEVPSTVYVNELTTLKMRITDKESGAPLSHVDWAIAVKDPFGNVVYKTTTAHSHAGQMDINVAFPIAGTNIVSLTASSIGFKMMGMDVPAMARTHTVLSGDIMGGWKTDPDNNFGTRTYEFPVTVLSEKQLNTIKSSEGNMLNFEMAINADQIVAGQPVTLVFTLTNADDGSMITHPDMQLKVRTGSLVISQSAPVDGMMGMNGIYHGHTGVYTLTTTFPRPGLYLLNADLNSLPVSNVQFGQASTRFVLQVADSTSPSEVVSTQSTPGLNTVNIVGIESPFFEPNSINVKAGTTLTFANVDGNIHTVTSVKSGTIEPDGSFDSGLMKAGDTFTVKLDKPGTYEYVCVIHTGMKGTVNVS
ncbi:MAG: plastocyanin/azurin family copper-binding protein [Nitrososphaera sp.]|jgi:plastocyanin